MCDRDRAGVVLTRACGGVQFVGTDCGDPLCPSCEPYRAKVRRDHWQPVAEKMRYPVWSIFSQRNISDLDQGKELLKSWRRFQDTRLGPRNQKRFGVEVRDYIQEHWRDEPIEVRTWLERCAKFERRLARSSEPLRVRDLTGRGFVTFEITYNPVADSFHPHLNVVRDSRYIPQPYLVVLWRNATRGEGEVVWVKKLSNIPEDMHEVVKYVCKPGDIPAARRGDLRRFLKGLRRVWPLGGAKPCEREKACPFCGEVGCKAHMSGSGVILRQEDTTLGKAVLVYYGQDVPRESWFVRIDYVWQQAGAVAIDLILRELACHSTPAPPVAVPVAA